MQTQSVTVATAQRRDKAKDRRAAHRARRLEDERRAAAEAEVRAEQLAPAAQRRAVVRKLRQPDGSTQVIVLREALLEPHEMPDPADLDVRSRAARRVRTYRKANLLISMQARGCPITNEHIRASDRYVHDWEVGRFGLTGERNGTRQQPGPRTAPPVRAMAQVAAQRALLRADAAMGADAVLIRWLLLLHRSLPSYCQFVQLKTGNKCDVKIETGRLLSALDGLAMRYGLASRRAQMIAGAIR